MESSRTRIRNRPVQHYQFAATECFFFVYFGTCSFGENCKFNHPVRRRRSDTITENIPETYARIPCKFFLAGRCKFGSSCAFEHAFPMPSFNPWLHFNALGFPKRWGKPDCSFYMQSGDCGYGTACKFHHPEPVFYYPDQGYGSYVGGEVDGYQSGYMPIYIGWTQKRVTITIKEPCVTLNDVGLPLRPEKKVCRHYENIGCCKFGRGCKFNHPMKWSSGDEKHILNNQE